MAQENHSLKSYGLAKEIERLEGFLKSYPVIGNLQSPNMPVKILNKANNLNKAQALTLPKDSASFAIYLRDAQKYGRKQFRKLMTLMAAWAGSTVNYKTWGPIVWRPSMQRLQSLERRHWTRPN